MISLVRISSVAVVVAWPLFLESWVRPCVSAQEQPPPGFSSRQAVMEAIASGAVKKVNPSITVPDSIEVKMGIQYGRGGEKALQLDLYGPADLTTLTAGASQVVKKFMGGHDIDETKDVYLLASPIHHVSKDDPPTLVLHGTIDQIVSVSQSDSLVENLKEHGVPYRYGRLEGWPHAMDIAEDVNLWCQAEMVHFFDQYLRTNK